MLNELLVSVALTPWWHVPLHREFAPLLVATDASSKFGFGGCVAKASLDEVRSISRLCMRVGEFVVLDSDDAPPLEFKGASAAFVGTTAFIFGGYGGFGYSRRELDDMHVLDTETWKWSKVSPKGTGPEKRSGHAMSAVENRLYVFGGWN